MYQIFILTFFSNNNCNNQIGADDPLYVYSHGSVEKSIPLEKYTENKNILFIEPSHGNHFGVQFHVCLFFHFVVLNIF